MRRAAFLDRDGVVNIDYGYVGRTADFHFVPGAPQALARLKKLGFFTVLVTNQSGIARGYYTVQDFLTLTAYMQRRLTAENAAFDAVYFCPHHEDGTAAEFRKACPGRKPAPGMILAAAAEYDLDLEHSILIGDHAGDLKAGAAAGVGLLYLVGAHIETEGAKLPPGAKIYKDLAHLAAQEFCKDA